MTLFDEQTAVGAEALKYPFLHLLVAPFGAEAMQPFSDDLKERHDEFDPEDAGGWFEKA